MCRPTRFSLASGSGGDDMICRRVSLQIVAATALLLIGCGRGLIPPIVVPVPVPEATFDNLTPSMVSRSVGTAQIPLSTERTLTTLPSGYREIPSMALDDDGVDNVTSPVVKLSSRPATSCGQTQATVTERI